MGREQLTFTVSGYTSGTVTIYINIERKEYNVQLVNVNADGSTSTLGDPFTVEYGRALVVPTDALLSLVREGYTFTGFYAYINGAGRQYIDANGNAVATGQTMVMFTTAGSTLLLTTLKKSRKPSRFMQTT